MVDSFKYLGHREDSPHHERISYNTNYTKNINNNIQIMSFDDVFDKAIELGQNKTLQELDIDAGNKSLSYLGPENKTINIEFFITHNDLLLTLEQINSNISSEQNLEAKQKYLLLRAYIQDKLLDQYISSENLTPNDDKITDSTEYANHILKLLNADPSIDIDQLININLYYSMSKFTLQIDKDTNIDIIGYYGDSEGKISAYFYKIDNMFYKLDFQDIRGLPFSYHTITISGKQYLIEMINRNTDTNNLELKVFTPGDNGEIQIGDKVYDVNTEGVVDTNGNNTSDEIVTNKTQSNNKIEGWTLPIQNDIYINGSSELLFSPDDLQNWGIQNLHYVKDMYESMKMDTNLSNINEVANIKEFIKSRFLQLDRVVSQLSRGISIVDKNDNNIKIQPSQEQIEQAIISGGFEYKISIDDKDYSLVFYTWTKEQKKAYNATHLGHVRGRKKGTIKSKHTIQADGLIYKGIKGLLNDNLIKNVSY